CSDTFQIIPPDYCSGCSALSKVRISNIQCNPATGTWSYDIFIPGPVPPIGDCWNIDFGPDRQFNTTYTIPAGPVSNLGCINPTFNYYENCNTTHEFACNASFDICPPKPCNNGNYESCDLEAYFDGIQCIDNSNGNYSYTVEFNVSDAPYPCYRSFTPGNLNLVEGSFSNPLGPFYDAERYFVIYSCGDVIPFTCVCPNTGCYKIFKVRKPEDCLEREDFSGNNTSSIFTNPNEVEILPNPVSEEWLLRSKLEKTEFEILSSSGVRIFSGTFNGSEHQLNIPLPKGLNLLKYKNSQGEYTSLKFAKL
ncbi:MAG: T9SS type A sorting domain-containing protein, partial [Saprospiraceae bacterium]|nr:T9SS type A sorting domain-containing protein [Saprospiraceae bacterium]